jgi:hypothetical protein
MDPRQQRPIEPASSRGLRGSDPLRLGLDSPELVRRWRKESEILQRRLDDDRAIRRARLKWSLFIVFLLVELTIALIFIFRFAG